MPPDSITILHFNDVYNIEGREKEPKGGVARFKTAMEEHQHLDPLVLFSGDALSPSNSELDLAETCTVGPNRIGSL